MDVLGCVQVCTTLYHSFYTMPISDKVSCLLLPISMSLQNNISQNIALTPLFKTIIVTTDVEGTQFYTHIWVSPDVGSSQKRITFCLYYISWTFKNQISIEYRIKQAILHSIVSEKYTKEAHSVIEFLRSFTKGIFLKQLNTNTAHPDPKTKRELLIFYRCCLQFF